MSNSQLLKWYSLRLLAVAFVIGFLSTSNAALIGYIAGTGLTDQDGTVAAFSIAYLIGGTLFSTFVHFFIGAVASVFGFLGVVFMKSRRKNSNDVGTPTPTAGGDAALIGFAKKFAVVVLLIAFAMAAWQSAGLYVLLSAASDAAGLIVLATVMTFILGFAYSTAVVGFIGLIASIMVAAVLSFLGGSGNSATR
jgi:hypothetical protein